MKKLVFLIMTVISVSMYAEEKNGIVYVKPNGTGDGSSWTNAMGDIQAAISAAKADNNARKDVWVGAGQFIVSNPISMVDSVNVYGSFAGTETTKEQRAKVAAGKAWEFTNPTTLKGDNSRLVQAADKFDMETLFDGFILTDGNGKGSSANGSGGAALLRPNMVLQNCIVQKSASAAAGGGIMMNTGGTVRFCLIKDNKHTKGPNGGGGIFCNTSNAGHTAYIEDCEITGNSSDVRGGGIGVQGNSLTYMKNLVIYNNIAEGKSGAAIFQNSPHNRSENLLIYNNTGASAVQLRGSMLNSTVVNNVGGVYMGEKTSTIEFSNNIVWGCATDVGGSTPTSLSGTANKNFTVHNNATYNPIATGNQWKIADNILFASNNSNGDVENADASTVGSGPKFKKVTTFKGAATADEELAQFANADWRLQSASPCVNKGKTVAEITTDIRGVARPQDTAYDMGAYEYSATEDVTSSKTTSEAFAYSLHVKDGQIVVSGIDKPANVRVYTLSGQSVYNNRTAITAVSVPVQSGIYIVKVNGQTTKVIVQ